MRTQAAEFVDRWEFEHVTTVPPSDRLAAAERLAAQCRQDAARAGISEQDLQDAVGGDLVGNMVQALDAAVFRQLARDQWADDEKDAGF